MAIVCAGCQPHPEKKGRAPLDHLVFTSPDRVMARRLRYQEGYQGSGYEGMKPYGPAIDVTNVSATILITALGVAMKPQEKKCDPVPGIAVEFQRSKEKAVILICFECDMVGVKTNGSYSWSDVDKEHRAGILDWAKAVFKDDKVIAALK